NDPGFSHHIIEPLVLNAHAVGFDRRRVGNATTRAAQATDFENVGKVAGEIKRQFETDRAVAVILYGQSLVGGLVPDKGRAHDVHRVFLQHDSATGVDIRVGEISTQGGIVVAHIASQQQRPFAVKPQLEQRQKARVVVKQSIGSTGGGTDVTVAVEDEETAAM